MWPFLSSGVSSLRILYQYFLFPVQLLVQIMLDEENVYLTPTRTYHLVIPYMNEQTNIRINQCCCCLFLVVFGCLLFLRLSWLSSAPLLLLGCWCWKTFATE